MQGGMLPRILKSWWAPRRVVRGLSAMPENVKLIVLMAAMLMFLIAQAPMHARATQIDPSVPLQARIGGSLLAVMFLMPLIAYTVAGLVSLLSRATRWRLEQGDSRLALFWALLAVSPAVLLSGLVAGLIGPGPGLSLTRALSGVGFLLIWAAGIRELVRRV